jgi:hypothetical protein
MVPISYTKIKEGEDVLIIEFEEGLLVLRLQKKKMARKSKLNNIFTMVVRDLEVLESINMLERHGINRKQLRKILKELIIELANERILNAMKKKFVERVNKFEVVSPSRVLRDMIKEALRNIE